MTHFYDFILICTTLTKQEKKKKKKKKEEEKKIKLWKNAEYVFIN
jgi:hypothetical protein